MKKHLLTILSFAVVSISIAQTPVNFNCNDCSGSNHDLFTEFNSGKVVVISWVMPCINCVVPTQNAYAVTQSYSVTNPGQVLFYIADDIANTNCGTLNTWCTTNIAANCKTFSNALVSMAPYGAAGMPKIIVMAGVGTHSVYFNQNGAAAGNTVAIQAAINQAINDITTAGIKENNSFNFELNVYPNPSVKTITVNYTLTNVVPVKFELFSLAGQKIKEINLNSNLLIGKNETKIEIDNFASGLYYLKLSSEKLSQTIKFAVNN